MVVSFDSEAGNEGPAVVNSNANISTLSPRELDQLYWRAVYAEREKLEMQQDLAEERDAARKRIGHLERENTKLRLLLKDSSTRLRSVRDMLDVQDREITDTIKAAGVSSGDAEGEMQKYYDAMKRIEGGHGGFRRKHESNTIPQGENCTVQEIPSIQELDSEVEVCSAELAIPKAAPESDDTNKEGSADMEEYSALEGQIHGVERQTSNEVGQAQRNESRCCVIA